MEQNGNIVKICFYSAGDGAYVDILWSFAHTFHFSGMEHDLFLFCDEKIPYATTVPSPVPLNDPKMRFKYELLSYLPKNYDMYIWMDADCYFRRKINDSLLKKMATHPLCMLLEDNLLTDEFRDKDLNWWEMKFNEIQKVANLFNLKEFRNSNGGFFSVLKDYIITVQDLCEKLNFLPIDEAMLTTACQAMSRNLPSLYNWRSEYAIDHHGSLTKLKYGVDYGLNSTIPTAPWIVRKWMHDELELIDPAVSHLTKSKNALIQYGKNIKKSQNL